MSFMVQHLCNLCAAWQRKICWPCQVLDRNNLIRFTEWVWDAQQQALKYWFFFFCYWKWSFGCQIVKKNVLTSSYCSVNTYKCFILNNITDLHLIVTVIFFFIFRVGTWYHTHVFFVRSFATRISINLIFNNTFQCTWTCSNFDWLWVVVWCSQNLPSTWWWRSVCVTQTPSSRTWLA